MSHRLHALVLRRNPSFQAYVAARSIYSYCIRMQYEPRQRCSRQSKTRVVRVDNQNGNVLMAIWLKRGADSEMIRSADRDVRETVEKTLADIEKRGDAALRDLSINSINSIAMTTA